MTADTRPDRHLVVIGGGITGLAAAWEASSAPGTRVTVLEASPRLGGKVRTSTIELPTGPLTVDEGADNFLAREPEAVELCHELGLGDELIHPAVGRAAVWSSGSGHGSELQSDGTTTDGARSDSTTSSRAPTGALRWFPTRHVLGVPLDVEDLAATGILSTAGLADVAAEVSCTDPPPDGDVGIGAFVAERFGRELVDHVVGPLVGGINAGDVDELSLRSVTPQLAAAADEGGSLTLALRRRVAATPPSGPVFRALRGGTEQLVTALADQLRGRRVELRTGTPVASLRNLPTGQVRIGVAGHADGRAMSEDDGQLDADAVVVATPAQTAARLLAEVDPSASAELARIEHVPVAFVTLAVRRDDISVQVGGTAGAEPSGVLVPRDAGLLVTAVSFGSTKWPHWDDGVHTVLRVAVGHRHDDRPSSMDDDELVRAARADIGALLGMAAEPATTRVTRWAPGFAQYRVGHGELVGRVHASLATAAPTVLVAGADLGGIGLPACIRQGRAAARTLLSR